MAGYWYGHNSYPIFGSQSSSILDGAELGLIQAGFDKFQAPTGYGTYILKYKTDESGVVASNVSISDAGLMTVPGGLTVSSGTVDLTATTPRVPTAAPGTNTTQAASTAFATALAFAAALPAQSGHSILTTNGVVAAWTADQTGNSGKYLATNGSVASWESIPNAGQKLYLHNNFGGF